MKHDHLDILSMDKYIVYNDEIYYFVTLATPSGMTHSIKVSEEDYNRLKVKTK